MLLRANMNTNNMSIRDNRNAGGSKTKYLLLLNDFKILLKTMVIEIAVPAIDKIIKFFKNVSLFPSPNITMNRYVIASEKHNNSNVSLFMIKLICYYI